eukprot:329113-Prorocentrum_lima.AAC.1
MKESVTPEWDIPLDNEEAPNNDGSFHTTEEESDEGWWNNGDYDHSGWTVIIGDTLGMGETQIAGP